MSDATTAPDDEQIDFDVDELSDRLRKQLSSRQIMNFELGAGITLDDLVRTQAGQLSFLVWASRVHGDHAISVDAAFALTLDELLEEVMKLGRDMGKATGVDEPSPTPTESNS